MKSERLNRLLIQILPALVLAGVLVFADRFMNAPDTSATDSDMVPPLPKINNSERNLRKPAATIALYSQFDTLKSDTDVKPENEQDIQSSGLTAEEQEQQQGLLRQLYIDNEVYRLSAVVNQRQYTANLTVTDVTSPEAPPRRLALKAGDKLHQYDVESVTAKRITLRHQQRELWLQLFTAEQAVSAER